MRSAKSVGRIIGLLLLVQLAGLIVPFVLLHPVTTGPRDYLANAAETSLQIKVAVFLLFANCALTIGIAIAAFPVFREYSYSMALLLLAVSVIMFSLQAVDNVHLLSMLSLSQRYGQAGGQDELFQTLAAAVGSTRRWAHYTELLVIDSWIFVLYSLLYRFALVPRALAAFGLITVMLHFTGITLQARVMFSGCWEQAESNGAMIYAGLNSASRFSSHTLNPRTTGTRPKKNALLEIVQVSSTAQLNPFKQLLVLKKSC